jgi:hypothetical protein
MRKLIISLAAAAAVVGIGIGTGVTAQAAPTHPVPAHAPAHPGAYPVDSRL